MEPTVVKHLADPSLLAAMDKMVGALQVTADRSYTLTGAADWPILAAMAGILFCMVAFMWVDLRTTIKDNRHEWRRELGKETDQLWSEIRRCQNDCRGKP